MLSFCPKSWTVIALELKAVGGNFCSPLLDRLSLPLAFLTILSIFLSSNLDRRRFDCFFRFLSRFGNQTYPLQHFTWSGVFVSEAPAKCSELFTAQLTKLDNLMSAQVPRNLPRIYSQCSAPGSSYTCSFHAHHPNLPD